jgi:hypothetical protein
MDSRQFVAMTKQYAVDKVVEEVVGALKKPRLPAEQQVAHNDVEPSISMWMNDHSLVERQRAEWFNQLTEENRKMVRAILEDCAERAVASFFILLDGVGGVYEGVFEVVAVDSEEQRSILNPQNTQMLHDLFSEVCEEGRQKT